MKWAQLEFAAGSAANVPKTIEQLADASEIKRRQAFSVLTGNLARDGHWFSASAPALELLLTVALGGSKDRHRALWLMTEILVGGRYHGFESPCSTAAEEGVAFAADVHSMASQCVDRLLVALKDPEPLVRSAAVQALAFTPVEPAHLWELLDRESEPVPKASALIALGLQEPKSEGRATRLAAYLDDTGWEVYTAAALSSLRQGTPITARHESALLDGLSRDRSPWEYAGMSPSALAAPILAPAAADVRSALSLALVRRLNVTESLTVAQSTEWPRLALALSGVPVDFAWDPRGYEPSASMLLPSELTDLQRKVLSELTADGLRFAGTDVPWDLLTRRRWLGLEEGTVMEKAIHFPPGTKTTRPVWHVWQELVRSENNRTHCLPSPLSECLSPAERIEGLLLASAGAYNLRHPWSDQERGSVFAWAREAGVDAAHVAQRFLQQGPAQTSERGVAVRILVQAGHAVEPEWDLYALTMVKNLKRLDLDLLAAIPPERREAVALQAAVDLQGIAQASDVLALVPTGPVAERYLLAIQRFARAAKGEVKETLKQALHATEHHAASHPSVAAALKATSATDWFGLK